ncbi:MAG: cation-transporting P-type ATPase [Chloroflexi bacterium]|nr:cation-transporting P-type ATPase [Chloroflexota bacterium]
MVESLPAAPLPWHARSIAESVAQLATDPAGGLSTVEAAARLRQHGPNELATRRREPWWEEAVEALTEPLVLLLLAVAGLYALLGELADALTIFVVILAVAGVELANETRARRAIGALRTLSAPTATVVRDGQACSLPTGAVVPGDLVLLQPGERVPADLRLVETVALRVDESSLSGESEPAAKQADLVLAPEAELGDRRNLAFAGTVVSAGKGRGIVVATGRQTELGRIARLAQTAREPRTPLQLHMRQLAGWLVWLALGFSVLVPVLGVLVAGLPLQEMLLTGLTLAFATVPEELPILITIVLGLGAFQLARQRAIVKRLRAAETLGSVSAIGTDKTGTLTENRMRVVALWAEGAPQEVDRRGAAERLLAIGVLANDAQLTLATGPASFFGDPTEVALLAAAEEAGLRVSDVRARAPVVEEHPFDDARKRMSVVYLRDGERWLAAKGAPEAILAVCSQALERGRTEPLDAERARQLQAAADQMAARGLRVLAFAERRLEPGERSEPASAEADLAFVGLAGLEDPPRPEAPATIAALRAAGVRVLMLTGDHPATARAVAERVGIDTRRIVLGRELERAGDEGLRGLVGEASVFARITPEHKLRLVRALQAQGEVVAVTGDGVNDAPALREAAIGVAMGRTGTDVAREAADLVLADDNLATVTTAVRAGRTLYANLRKAVRYYLAAKVALVTSSLVAVLAHLPVPFAPVQIIVLELFMDLGASTTFVAEPPEEDLMARPPRDPRQPFMDRSVQLGILGGGLSLAGAVLIAYFWAWSQGLGLAAAQTTAFAAWMVGHLALAAHMRSERQPLLRSPVFANRPFLLWAASALALVALGVTLPFLQARLHVAPLPPTAWAVALAAGLLCPAWWEGVKWARWRP